MIFHFFQIFGNLTGGEDQERGELRQLMMKFGQQDLDVHLPVIRYRNCLALRVIAGCLRCLKS